MESEIEYIFNNYEIYIYVMIRTEVVQIKVDRVSALNSLLIEGFRVITDGPIFRSYFLSCSQDTL